MANLLKAGWVTFEDETLVIDNNELADNRIREQMELDQMRRDAAYSQPGYEEGFSEGLTGEQIDPDSENILQDPMYDEEGYAEEGEPMEGVDAEQLDQLTRPQAAPPPPQPQIDEEALQAQVDEILAGAEQQAQEVLAQAQIDAEALKQQAMEEGRQAGHDEGYAAGVADAEALKADIEAERENMQREYKKMVDAIEPEMVDVLTQIYEHVFAVDFRSNKNIIMHLVKSTLSHIEGSTNLIVHVSADDYDMIIDEKEHLQEMVTGANVTMEIIEDPLLKENECTIETENGVFDCGVGTELEELSRKLKLLSFERR